MVNPLRTDIWKYINAYKDWSTPKKKDTIKADISLYKYKENGGSSRQKGHPQ